MIRQKDVFINEMKRDEMSEVQLEQMLKIHNIDDSQKRIKKIRVILTIEEEE